MIRAGLLSLLLLAGCASVPDNPPRTVERVDLERYAGTWYEVARFPVRFQDGPGLRCEDVTATYALCPDGQVGVRNACRNGLAEGRPERVANGTAHVVAGSPNTRLRVSFFWPFYGDYWVIGLDPDYRWAVVGAPRRDYLWILSRTPEMAPGDYVRAVATATQEGFDTSRLQPTRQSPR
ncbi:MAG: lipocalin family protein [Acetobacteraceae bacterium]|nr:lipocalin family protein [Acetobacteraceae bacterium]